MVGLREKYRWIDDFEGTAVTVPIVTNSFIEIDFGSLQVSFFRIRQSLSKAISVFYVFQSDALREHCQFRSTLPFARSECHCVPIVDIRQMVNSETSTAVKTVYELTLKLAVSATGLCYC